MSDSSAILKSYTYNWGHYGFLMSNDSSYLSDLSSCVAQNLVWLI